MIAEVESHIRQTAHGGGNKQKDWGGVPIIILVGDDKQLQSISRGVLDLSFPFNSDDRKLQYTNAKPTMNIDERMGEELWFQFAKDVMQLNQIARVNENQQKYKQLQNNARDDKLNTWDVAFLKKYHVEDGGFTKEQQQEIKNNAMYVFAKKEPMKEHNTNCLKKIVSENNPLACIEVHSSSQRDGKTKGIASHFDNETIPRKNTICRGAMVSIMGKNFMPQWSLYNGSIGTVEEIIFEKGENPNQGHQP